jgi:phosphinothricin acetyltransferase
MLEIRAATADDADAIAHIYAPYVATNAVSFEEVAPSTRVMRSRIMEHQGHYPWLVAVEAGSPVVLGYACAKPFRAGPSYRFVTEIAIYAGADLEGRGVRKTLLGSLIATLTAQDFTQAICTLPTPNDKLIQLYEGAGFRRAGQYREISFKHNQWHDVGMWQRELSEPGAPPSDPKPFSMVGVVRG